MANRKAAFRPGDRVGKYRILKALDVTGASAFYLAEHPHLGRRVGLKILFEDLARDEAEVQRFFRDAALVAKVKHPSLADVFDADLYEGRPFMIMEFVEGRSLEQIMTASPDIDIPVALRLMVEIVGALQAAHEIGLIHRDIEPANIIINPTGIPVLVGMGRPGRAEVNPPPGFPGAPSFTSPELVACEPDDGRSDTWSVGATMYYIFLHRERVARPDAMAPTRIEGVVDLSAIEGRAPSYALRIVERCLQPDPCDRYASARELRQALETALDFQEPSVTASLPAASGAPRKNLLVRVEYHQPDLPGDFREYRVEALIGRGSFGDVYHAVDLQAEMDIALKVLRAEWLDDKATVSRFRREATLQAGLTHPNIVNLYNFGRLANTYFIALQHVTAPTLRRLLAEEGTLDPARALAVLDQILLGLEALHERDVIHRDLKPGNLFVDGERALIADLGIAYAKTAQRLTVTGAVAGSPAYMSPEQARGLEPGPLSDIFAAGVVLYEMLSGARPYEADSVARLVQQVAYAPAVPLDERRPDLPAPLLRYAARLLARDPNDRPQSTAGARRELTSVRAACGWE